jgi:hypothetical protein
MSLDSHITFLLESLMFTHFGYIEEYININGRRWRGVAKAMPHAGWFPSENDNWIHGDTKEKVNNIMIREIKCYYDDCKKALDSLA